MLVAALTGLYARGTFVGRALCSLLGQWSSLFQFRRPAYSIFSSVCHFARNINLSRKQVLPIKVVDELLAAAFVISGLSSQLRYLVSKHVYESNPSTSKAGVAQAEVEVVGRMSLNDLAEEELDFTKVGSITEESSGDKIRLSQSGVVCFSQRWFGSFWHEFKLAAHIRMLEGEAFSLHCVEQCVAAPLRSVSSS